MAAKTPVWLDVDTGHDDVFAILLTGHHPSLNLIGITSTHGNAATINTTANTSSVLTAIGRKDVTVYPGTSHPFCRPEVDSPLSEIHGPTGLSGTTLIPPPEAPISKENAILAMRNAIMSTPPGTAWIVATGSMTNPALCFAVFPEVASHIAGLSIMGGAVGGGFTDIETGTSVVIGKDGEEEAFGNETPWAEFNIYVDPESARSIFINPVLANKTTLISLDLTHQCLATRKVREFLLHGATGSPEGKEPSRLRRLNEEILAHFASSYEEFFEMSRGPPLHDPLAVAAIFGFENDAIFPDDGARYSVSVVTAGEHGTSDEVRGQVGRTVVTKLPDGSSGGVRIPRKLNVDAFWKMLEQCYSIAEANGAML
ncbi:nucleoside hydrolase [Rhizodiscina lignyota]|uniref:Nucleoside hydrolase n=1 Tax=Rhizodiscina lignyota TaxID=1504668 RepID=A0A9P4IF26_9PEZI|nr:nucleoside hydrolase [Rhizodiscina lignyota]